MRHIPLPRQLSNAVALIVLTIISVGCAVGERPTLTSEPLVLDEQAIAVQESFRRNVASFTAIYEITPSTPGVEPRNARVIRGDDQMRITIGSVDYFIRDSGNLTCIDNLEQCFDDVRDGYVSDLNITHDFYGPAMTRRLRNDLERRIGPSTTTSTEIGGVQSACVDIHVAGGMVTYCANDFGLLARYAGADVAVELQSVSADIERYELEPALPPLSTPGDD